MVSVLTTRGVKMSVIQIYMSEIFSTLKETPVYDSDHIKSTVLLDQRDGFFDLLMALETNFNLEGEGLLVEDNFASVSTP